LDLIFAGDGNGTILGNDKEKPLKNHSSIWEGIYRTSHNSSS
jgi:hypothetical protein